MDPDRALHTGFSHRRKWAQVAIVSFSGFLVPFATTSLFAALPELAAYFDTTVDVINWTNAGFCLAMSFGLLFWGRFTHIYGKKPTYTVSTIMFTVGNLSGALSKSLPAFVVCRYIVALGGCASLGMVLLHDSLKC